MESVSVWCAPHTIGNKTVKFNTTCHYVWALSYFRNLLRLEKSSSVGQPLAISTSGDSNCKELALIDW